MRHETWLKTICSCVHSQDHFHVSAFVYCILWLVVLWLKSFFSPNAGSLFDWCELWWGSGQFLDFQHDLWIFSLYWMLSENFVWLFFNISFLNSNLDSSAKLTGDSSGSCWRNSRCAWCQECTRFYSCLLSKHMPHFLNSTLLFFL